MGQKDLAQNDYFNDKVRFADACNGILFKGRNVIRPEELQEMDADIVYQEEEGKLRKIIPDKVRKWNGMYIAILSVENQSNVDYKMVFRAMKAEAVNYERQWKEREQEYKRSGMLHEKANLCWVGRGEKFVPVITVVIYYGTEEKWDGARCLYDMLGIDKELEPYVTNYKLNLFDYHECKDFSVFKTENRILFEVLSCADDERKMAKLISDNSERYHKLTPETAQTICDIAGISRKWIQKNEMDKKEEVNMCKAWDDHKESGRQEGRQEGRAEAICSIMDSLNVTVERAMDILKIAENERSMYMEMMGN